MQGREGKEGEEKELGKWGVGEREGGGKEDKDRWQGAACVIAPVMASGVGSYLGAQPPYLPSTVSTWCRLLQSRYPSDVPAARHSQPTRPLCSSGPELVNFIQLQYTTTHKIDAPRLDLSTATKHTRPILIITLFSTKHTLSREEDFRGDRLL